MEDLKRQEKEMCIRDRDVIVREDDCHTEKGLLVEAIKSGNEVIEPLEERISGRYALEPCLLYTSRCV